MSESIDSVESLGFVPATCRCHKHGFLNFLYFLILYDFSAITMRELLLMASQDTVRRMLILQST